MNFSLSEIMVILLIAILVIRPEQMPDVAFTLGRLVKGVRQFFNKMTDDMRAIVETVEKPEQVESGVKDNEPKQL